MDIYMSSAPLQNDETVSWWGAESILDRSNWSEILADYHVAKNGLLTGQASVIMRSENVASRTTAEAAMAEGARRAAGFLPKAEADAFTGVRTSIRPRKTAACSESNFNDPFSSMALQQHHLRYVVKFPSTIAPPKPSLRLSSTEIENRVGEGFATSGEESISPCLLAKTVDSTADRTSPGQLDFYSHGKDRIKQHAESTPPQNFRLNLVVSPESRKLEQCVRDSSSLSVSTVTAMEKTGAFQAGDVYSYRKPVVSIERSAIEVSAGTSMDQTRLAEDSKHRRKVVEAAATAKKPPSGRSSARKGARAAEIHNLSERRRRDKINLKLKTLQDLIPNANKTDKASVLDEAIEYMKMLQAQIQVMALQTGLALPQVMFQPKMQDLLVQDTSVFPYIGMGQSSGIPTADDNWPSTVPLLPLQTYSLPESASHVAFHQSTTSSSVNELYINSGSI